MKPLFIKSVLAMLALAVSLSVSGQAKKPTIMVIPADVWCNENGFTVETDYQGRHMVNPDYERAVKESVDLVNVTTKIGALMADRGFPLKDMASAIRTINQDMAEDEMTVSSAGSALAETPLERLANRAKAD
ncbi:MAG: DUF6175 family protein, partial [Bacteroides sp.]|nr:DUF6175 family protein [Bacteroides sp.]